MKPTAGQALGGVRLTVGMRSSETQRTERLGIKAVEKAFVDLHWGTLNTREFDVGTDLVLVARDARLFELGLYVGAQVKTGPTAFAKPKKDEGDVIGWWWYDPKPDKHLNAWASFPLPQLLILHDLEKDRSYWVHVTSDRVLSTGKGAKILVPAGNTIDPEHLDELIAVAGTVRGAIQLEGSAWTPGRTVPVLDQLRYALIAPRLIAPHPNAGKEEPISAAQALALVTQVRTSDLLQFAQAHQSVPTPDEARESEDYGWRLVGGLMHWMHGNGTGALQAVADEASDAHVRVAAVVAATTALIVEGAPEEGRLLVEKELERDDARPVDHAWLVAQHARLCLDLGDDEVARADSAAVISIGAATPGDVTATAIAGSAVITAFNATPWQDQRVQDVIAAADNTASWWRDQVTAVALEAVVNRGYSAWGRDRTVTIAAEDQANNRLLSAALIASNAADHADWRHVSGLLGRDMLMRLGRHADTSSVAAGIDTLRLAGAEKAIGLAVPHLVADGPAAGVMEAARRVDLSRSTRTLLISNLTLLRHGSDVLDSGAVQAAIDWLIPHVRDPTQLERSSGIRFLERQLMQTLAELARGAEPAQQAAIIESVASLPSYDEEDGRQAVLAAEWARVIRHLPSVAWTPERLADLAARIDDLPPSLGYAIRGLIARDDPAEREKLGEEVASGSLAALEAYGNVTELSTEVAASVIKALSQHVDGVIERAHERTYAAGHDVGEALVLLNSWHPGVAAWDPVYRLLGDAAVSDSDKIGTLTLLVTNATRLTDDVGTRLKPIAAAVAQREAPVQGFPLGDKTDARGVAALLEVALGALTDAEAASRVVELLAGDAESRQWAVHLAHRLAASDYTGIIVALTDDEDVAVRAAAASALALLVKDGTGGPLAVIALQRAAREPGVLVPKEIARVLGPSKDLPDSAAAVLTELQSHPSWRVRSLAEGEASE